VSLPTSHKIQVTFLVAELEIEKWDTYNDTSHMLQVKSDDGDELCIPFGLRGVTSYFPTCKPTQSELANC
jgi:hypothetical protein